MVDKLKMYCVVSKEALRLMNGNRGKMMTQAGHAYVHAYLANISNTVWNWRAEAYIDSGRSYKITLFVETTAELLELHEHYKDKCGTALVEDAGFTVFEQPTVTCLGIGPIRDVDKCEKLINLRPLI